MEVVIRLWLTIASTVLYYAIYPLLVLGTGLFYLVRFVASPFIYLAYVLKEVVLLHVRLLAKFEASNVRIPNRINTDTNSPYGTFLAQQCWLERSLGSCCTCSAERYCY